VNTKTILIVIALLLAGILGFMAYQEYNTPKTPMEQLGADLEDAADDVGDAIEGLGEDIQDAAKPKP
jgi:predicted small secreted protein